MYRTYNARPIPKPYRQSRKRKYWLYILLLVAIITVYGAYALLRPLPAAQITLLPPVIPAQVRIPTPWPAKGQAAFGADEYGILSSHGEQTPRPTASIAKAITALAVLEKKPLKTGDNGPVISVTAQDVALYNSYLAKDGSVVPISQGTTFTEYQALQAMMLPSANNIADTTAIWAFGSMDAYTAYANEFVRKLGMINTTVKDASGFSPQTMSTATDLVILGDAVLDHEILAEIVAQSEAEFPGYGTIRNVNSFLGQSGIRGIKTGNTDEAGGCYLAAADITIGGKKITVITAILGETSRPEAMHASIPIIQSSLQQFYNATVINQGQHVGSIKTAWGQTTDLIAKESLMVTAWKGKALSPQASSPGITVPFPSGAMAGTLHMRYAGSDYDVEVQARSAVTEPSVFWRLTHPF